MLTAQRCMQANFNILCEQPETVAAFLVPRVRTTVAKQAPSSYIRFLTPQRAIASLLMAPFRTRRFFDGKGAGLWPVSAVSLLLDGCWSLHGCECLFACHYRPCIVAVWLLSGTLCLLFTSASPLCKMLCVQLGSCSLESKNALMTTKHLPSTQ